VDENTIARLTGHTTFADLLAALDELRAEHAPARLVCTLDDVDQCAYTSGHASLDDRFAGDDIAAALDDPALRVGWDALPGERVGGAADVATLVDVHRDPDRVLDELVLVQRVPVPRDDLVIAGIPNGYFEADWDTFENHAIVRRMAAHGYRHFGIGAALLGFDRPAAPTAAEARAVVADLVHLYGAPDSAGWSELAALLTGQRLLFLGYTEDFADVF
jgi:hypothetical protein